MMEFYSEKLLLIFNFFNKELFYYYKYNRGIIKKIYHKCYKWDFFEHFFNRPCPKNASVQCEARMNTEEENIEIMKSDDVACFIEEVIPRYRVFFYRVCFFFGHCYAASWRCITFRRITSLKQIDRLTSQSAKSLKCNTGGVSFCWIGIQYAMPYSQKYTLPHCFFCNFAGWDFSDPSSTKFVFMN